MSDTPQSDKFFSFVCAGNPNGPHDDEGIAFCEGATEMYRKCQEFERELNAANSKIAKLKELVVTAEDLNSIVDGPFNIRWSHNCVRLTDTPQWCAFYVAMNKSINGAQPDEKPTPYAHELFDHMSKEHNLTLVESELTEIMRICERITSKSSFVWGDKQNDARKFCGEEGMRRAMKTDMDVIAEQCMAIDRMEGREVDDTRLTGLSIAFIALLEASIKEGYDEQPLELAQVWMAQKKLFGPASLSVPPHEPPANADAVVDQVALNGVGPFAHERLP